MTSDPASPFAARADRLLGLALRAFPPRWRREYGSELLDLSADLRSEGTSLRLAEAAGLVRGGWAVRLRNRPPLRSWLGYRLLERPVPMRWHGWMRDDLEGRWLGLRLVTSRMLPVSLVWILLLLGPAGRGDRLNTTLIAFHVAMVVAGVIGSVFGWPARRFRRILWTRAGYTADGSRYLVPPPPVASDLREPAEFLPWGARRCALAPLALPVGGWAMLAGLAAMLGATAPDEPFRLGGVTARRDPNSPLDRPVVLAALAAALVLAALVALVVGRLAARRVLAAPDVTIHGLNALPVSDTVFASLVSAVGLCLAGAGGAGIWPDQAATAMGALGLMAGAALVRLGLLARHHSARLGRPVTLGDLTVGERVVMVPVPGVRGSTR